MKTEWYKILRVSKDASEEEIRKSYILLAKRYHPDSYAGRSDAEKKFANNKLKEVNDAYDRRHEKYEETESTNSKEENSSNDDVFSKDYDRMVGIIKKYNPNIKDNVLFYFSNHLFNLRPANYNKVNLNKNWEEFIKFKSEEELTEVFRDIITIVRIVTKHNHLFLNQNRIIEITCLMFSDKSLTLKRKLK